MEMELGGGLFWSCWPKNQWTVGPTLSHNPNSYTPRPARMERWTDGEPVIFTSNLLRDSRSIKCHASHARESVLAFCSWLFCRENGFAMSLRLTGPHSLALCLHVSSEAVMRLRDAFAHIHVSLQCVCATQYVFAMHPRHPNASSKCVCASSECVRACSCICTY